MAFSQTQLETVMASEHFKQSACWIVKQHLKTPFPQNLFNIGIGRAFQTDNPTSTSTSSIYWPGMQRGNVCRIWTSFSSFFQPSHNYYTKSLFMCATESSTVYMKRDCPKVHPTMTSGFSPHLRVNASFEAFSLPFRLFQTSGTMFWSLSPGQNARQPLSPLLQLRPCTHLPLKCILGDQRCTSKLHR